jgi:hypothetical protein
MVFADSKLLTASDAGGSGGGELASGKIHQISI